VSFNAARLVKEATAPSPRGLLSGGDSQAVGLAQEGARTSVGVERRWHPVHNQGVAMAALPRRWRQLTPQRRTLKVLLSHTLRG